MNTARAVIPVAIWAFAAYAILACMACTDDITLASLPDAAAVDAAVPDDADTDTDDACPSDSCDCDSDDDCDVGLTRERVLLH